MCFESIKTKDVEFTSEILRRFRLHESKSLNQLGFLEITDDEEGKVLSARCIHNQLMEYCAAMHVADDSDALQYIQNIFTTERMSESLGFWQDTLIFSVGINHEVLSAISGSSFALRVSLDKEKDQHQCLDLSYEARLMQETDSMEAREQFCEALMKAPLELTRAKEVISCIYVLFTKIKLLLLFTLP